MNDLIDGEVEDRLVDDTGDPMPPHLKMIDCPFDFMFEDFSKILASTVSCNNDMLESLEGTHKFIQNSELDGDEKQEVLNLISQEIQVVSYAHTARCSVISI